MSLVALVVDDSMLIRHTVCRYLEERGFEVESATNGREALDLLAGIQPNLIVTDMQMPVMGGCELITELKSRPETAKIPVVVLSGRQSGFDGKEERAHYCIYKDIDIDSQLEKALKLVMHSSTSKGKAAGK
jgi:CheY-like chemotaxis protein